jgi:hypothetical protein
LSVPIAWHKPRFARRHDPIPYLFANDDGTHEVGGHAGAKVGARRSDKKIVCAWKVGETKLLCFSGDFVITDPNRITAYCNNLFETLRGRLLDRRL